MKRPAYRHGKVHVLSEECATCIFRPGNLMHLMPRRVAGMVRNALANDSAIICHSTLDKDEAVCRGFYDRHQHNSASLRIAIIMRCITEVPPP